MGDLLHPPSLKLDSLRWVDEDWSQSGKAGGWKVEMLWKKHNEKYDNDDDSD